MPQRPVAQPPTSPLHLPRLHVRVRNGIKHPHNWFELVRFGLVGASGYVVNLLVFAACIHLLGLGYVAAAVAAFVVAITNNFFWNRHWTFSANDGHAGFQALRFVTVSVVAFGINLAVLALLVNLTGMSATAAQAVAICCATPVTFVGNKLWSFRV